MKRDLWGIVTSIKVERDYLIGVEVIIETDCLPILGIIANCDIPDQAMLRWCIYIRSINPEVRHISRNRNAVADMLSRARYKEEEVLDSDDKDKEQTILTTSITWEGGMQFLEKEYEEEFKEIGKYLQTPDKYKDRSGKDFAQFRKKSPEVLI